MSDEMMRRREVLRRAAWMLGGAISAPAALAILQGCEAKKKSESNLEVLRFLVGGPKADVVREIADIMIPKTDTGGAVQVGIVQFIDSMLADVYDAAAQARFNAGFDEFMSAAESAGRPFLEQERAQRVALVKQSLEKALDSERSPKPFILVTRELTLLGFYTSRVGITENMEYVAVPTAYHGCVPLSQMKKPVYWE
jgi:gluconate 2-dehydrogenase gamma chain